MDEFGCLGAAVTNRAPAQSALRAGISPNLSPKKSIHCLCPQGQGRQVEKIFSYG
jgi:hypothetical protein